MFIAPHLSTSDTSIGETLDAMIKADLEAAAGGGGTSSSPTHASHSTSAVEAAPASVPCTASLSPDALMAYCQSRLNSLDSQMSQIMAQQQSNQTGTSAIDNVATLLNDLPSSSATPPTITVTQAQWAAISKAYGAAASACPQLSSQLDADQAAFANMNTHPAGSGSNVTLDITNLSQLEQSLKNDASNMNSDSEMIMINLQSLMSQRQTAVQLTTNLVQSLGDQASSIAKNIGQ